MFGGDATDDLHLAIYIWVGSARSAAPARLILQEAGFNLNTIKSRIRSICAHILAWKSEQSKTVHKFSSEPLPPSMYELAAAHEKIDRLERKLKRSQQELEFVKKIINAGKEG